ncbi:AAA family ATPase [Geomonas sp. RF6]|uniref:trifunctional serine/threonine-protein kinase/ATP-binding protein/sensor histidine kinase n=1 Tax=Geomonas sp. RF6 TaxID=2897342 RepID=UPI001E5CA152|nr:trifunctional serine/threonine-protein kinase/ATP-binding protein/sensor histidine kinase [Geomonas sp. RF6]UFS69447.1 AAA family ATPase [Geomonas sp. RF6]
MTVEAPGYEIRAVASQEADFVLFRAIRLTDGAAVYIRAPSAQYPEVRILTRLDHEFQLASLLEPSWALKPIELVQYREQSALVLHGFSGAPLSALTIPTTVKDFLDVAIAFAAALRSLHKTGLVHMDLKPPNVLIDRDSGELRISGFGIATPRPPHAPPAGSPFLLQGTPSYMAPEQTGQINRGIEDATDLYSAGVIFYQMLTGDLPFLGTDLLEQIHCIVAVTPVAPCERRREVPRVLSDILMKLLAKLPEERYRTAAGLHADLVRCRDSLMEHGDIIPFELGERDVCSRLYIPQHLYGRDREVAALMAAYEEVRETEIPRLALVTGYAGIGKSALVAELHAPLIKGRAFFASGKFEQYMSGKPYATISQALKGVVQQILMEPEERLATWRDRMQEAVGVNGRLLVELVPEIEHLLGRQPEVPDLPLTEGEQRFHLLLHRFLQLFCFKGRPFVLFLDDLQWADPATLNLLTYILPRTDTRSIMVIAAYRDNEVGPGHPAMLAVEDIRRAGVALSDVILEPLQKEEVQRLVADSLRADLQRTRPLADLIMEKTGANPFFLIQFLSTLHRDGLVTCNPDQGTWEWDLDRIGLQQYTDNVVTFLVQKMRGMPQEVSRALQIAACVGTQTDLGILRAVAGSTEAEIDAALWYAIQEGLLFRQENSCSFVHDRVLQAAYSLSPQDERESAHLKIGRIYFERFSEAADEDLLFDMVGHFNRGHRLIDSAEDRVRVAGLNLQAARRAQASAAYRSGKGYAGAGLEILGDLRWTVHTALGRALTFEMAKCAWLAGEVGEADRLLEEEIARAEGAEKAEMLLVQSKVAMTRGDPSGAAVKILDALGAFGIAWPAHPSPEEVQREYEEIWSRLGNREIAALVDLPAMTDPTVTTVMEILAELYLPAYWIDLNLQLLVTCRMVNLSLEYGNSDSSPMGYAALGRLLGPKFGRHLDGYHFGKAGYDLVEKRKLVALKARVSDLFGISTSFWVVHLRQGLEYARISLKAGNEVGDLPYACYACMHIVTYRIALAAPLQDVYAESQTLLEFVSAANYEEVADIIRSLQRFIGTIRAEVPGPALWSEEVADDDRFGEHIRQNRSALVVDWYLVAKLQACVLMGKHGQAVNVLEELASLVSSFMTQLNYTDYVYYSALALAGHLPEAPPSTRSDYLSRLALHLETLAGWTLHGPDNFRHRELLVRAELYRLQDRPDEAGPLYDEAIAAARKQGFLQHEGLAQELAGRFHVSRNEKESARRYLFGARYAFARWGATAKVAALNAEFPALLREERQGGAVTPEQLDLLAVVKASQAISQQMELSQVVDTLLRVVMEHSGADRSVLLMMHEGEAVAVAKAGVERGGEVAVLQRTSGNERAETPSQVVNFVKRVGEPVLLDDARTPSPYMTDPYFGDHHPLSVACLPIVRQRTVAGIIYLENHLVVGTFTRSRLSLLEVLAAQAAISLQNAHLFSELLKAKDELEDRVKERTADLSAALQELQTETEKRIRAVEEVREKEQMLIQQSRQVAMGDMLVNISHHWRQPLNVVSALVQELGFTHQLGELTEEVMEQNVAQVQDIIGQLSQTISDFDELLTPQKEKTYFDVNSIIGRTVALVEESFKNHMIAIEQDLHGTFQALGSPNDFSQVILNLLANARDAFLERNIAERLIRIDSRAEGSTIIVTVTDTAGGIAEDIIGQIFDPYFTTKELGKGSGIGLFLSKIIIEKNMAGRLTVHNVEGGARFTIMV